MIKIKLFSKPKETASTSRGSVITSSGVVNVSGTEANHAATADRATKADYADKAGSAATADYASNAAYAAHAGLADTAMQLDQNSPVFDTFLRKDKNDTSDVDYIFGGNVSFKKIVSMLKGLAIGKNCSVDEAGDAVLRDISARELSSSDYDYAAQSGYGMKRREDGKFKLSLTDLEVWGKAVFHELEIRKLSYVGGNFIFSPAGSTLMHVEEVKNETAQGVSSIITGYKCYFLADNGTTATENMWKVGDLAYSQSFGIKEGVYENVGNRRYWRKVTAVSSESEQITDADGNVLYDGQKFGWITLSNLIPGAGYEDGSDAPRAGDAVCCLGNVSDEERQNAIEIQTVGDLAPAIIQYGGIKTFSLTNCVKTQISPKGNKFIGDFSTTTGTDIGGAITDINSNLSDTNGRITNLNDYTTNAVKKIEGEITDVKKTAEDAESDAQDALEGVTQVKGSVTTLQTDVNGITGTVAKLSEKVDENGNQIEALETSVSEIKQTADSISMKVDQQSVRGRNLIPRSYFFNTSRIYGIGQRKFTLEAGKYYSLSVNGHIDAALKNGGGVLRAFIFNSAWTFQKYLDIDSTTDITATLEGNSSFTVESTGEYYFQAYPFHPTGKFKDTKPQEDGLITLNWAQLEEGSVCSPWSLHESDPAISGNFLPTLSDDKWSRVGDIQEGALDTGFRKLQALHYKNTSSSEVDVLYMNNVFAPDSGEVYTLSFWVKGSGTFKSFLYPEACERVADNFGQVGTQEDGYLPHTLTSDWQRIRIAYCTKQLFGNYFYNAGFNAASGYTSNWDVTGSTRHIASAADGWGGQYISKSSGASYCEISQAVGASLWASWWTVTFKSKNPSAMRIYLSGIYLDTIDNSGMTVCVDGVDQSVKSDSGVLYVEVDASATAYTEHSITFKASSALSSARIYFRTYGSYFYIAKPMLTPAPQKSGFSTREQGTVRCILPCRLEAGSEVWIGGVKLEQGGRMTDYTEDGVSVDELLATGIDIRSRKITATADTFEVRNNKGEVTTTVDADGQLTAGILATKNRGSGFINAEDGLMKVFNGDGHCNIQFGVDPNSGMMVLSYYDNNGNLLYNLGPNGLENKDLTNSVLTEYGAERLGTFFNNKSRFSSVTGVTLYDDEVYHADSDGNYIIDSTFKSRLCPSSATGEGYEPTSALNKGTYIYYYRAAKVSAAYIADTTNGITTPALAEQANDKWFFEKPICQSGTLQLINSGEYIMSGEALHWGKKKNSSLNQLAIYFYSFDSGVRERFEVFLE